MQNADISLAAYCGLYCGACSMYKKGKCPGCHSNSKASWCKIRSCCTKNNYQTCSECKEFSDPQECRKFNNFMSKLFGIVFHSDRATCIHQIRQKGLEQHIAFMKENDFPSLKKGTRNK